MNNPTQYCTFHVGGLFLGLDVLSVQEVLRASPLSRVPLAPPTVEGLLNLRGQIVTTIDLRRRLGFEPRQADAEPMFMIVRTADGHVSLLVDSVGDVIEVTDESFEAPPETLAPATRSLIRGVHKLPKHLLHLLDPEQATHVSGHAA